MGMMANSLLWVMQDLYHQPYRKPLDAGSVEQELATRVVVLGGFRV